VNNGNTTVSEASTVTVSSLPSISYAAATYSFIRNNTISSLSPVVGAGSSTPSSYSVSPALPTGLTLNTATGVISGRPTALAATADYVVTASTAAGCTTTFTLSLEVKNDAAPLNLVYNPNSQTVRQGTAINNMVPTVGGGAVITYTIAPSLPSGISINATTGVVSGNLSAAQTGSQVYTITATNSGGSATATITLIFNSAPTDITLSATSIAENNAANAAVGTMSSTDPDAGDTHTYTLVSGTGSTDNAAFNISGNSLRVSSALNFEAKSSYSIRVRTTDAGGLSFEKVFTLTVSNVNEAPTNINSTQLAIYENNAANATVSNLSSIDPDAGDTHTYTLVSGAGSADNNSFNIVNNQLRAAVTFKFKDKSSYSIRIRTTDAGGLSFEKTFTISIIESPVASGTGNLPGTNQITASSNDVTISKGYSSQLNVAGPGLVTYSWSPSIGLSATNVANPIASPSQTTVYTVTVTNAAGLTTVLYVTVNVVEDYNVTPTNIITPNGDGINDYWVIDNLDSYPDNEVQIFDKAGRILYQVKNYQNNWDGTINSNLLAEGTYYYVINFGSGKKIKKGYITIIRD
jgi:gliding motility-associated-like protein